MCVIKAFCDQQLGARRNHGARNDAMERSCAMRVDGVRQPLLRPLVAPRATHEPSIHPLHLLRDPRLLDVGAAAAGFINHAFPMLRKLGNEPALCDGELLDEVSEVLPAQRGR